MLQTVILTMEILNKIYFGPFQNEFMLQVWVSGEVVDQTQGGWSVITEDQGNSATCLTYCIGFLDDGDCSSEGDFICGYDL